MQVKLKQAIFDKLTSKAQDANATRLLREALKENLNADGMLAPKLVEDIVAYLVKLHPSTIVRNKFGRVSRFENLEGATENHAKAAQNFYERHIAAHDPAKKDGRGRSKKEHNPVADLLKQFNALTAKQKKQFLASV
jgi:hypothetical protein